MAYAEMDMLKLLSRSTNLKPSVQAKQAPTHHLPSDGNSHPLRQVERWVDEHPDERPTPDSSSAPGAKRKRDYNEVESEAELDFFGDQDGRATKNRKQEERHGAQEAKSMPVSTMAIQITSSEDCRRILKQHKLKVTLVENVEQAGQQPKKGRQDTTLPRIEKKKSSQNQLFPQPLSSFKDLRSKYGISRRLAENLDAQGYRVPTEVQLGSLPLLLGLDEDRGLIDSDTIKKKKHRKSDIDLLTVAPTGSGKTLAFLISVLQGLIEHHHARKKVSSSDHREHQVEAIIVAPTHELADQIVNEGKKLAIGTGIKVAAMRKGMRLHSDLHDDLKNGFKKPDKDSEGEDEKDHEKRQEGLVKADVVVSTPLMLLHAITPSSGFAPSPLPAIRYLVLDEADVLLDPLFRTQTLSIWDACTSASLQTSLWSATVGSSIESLAQTQILTRRRSLNLSLTPSHHIIRLVVGLKDSAIPNISHRLIYAASEPGKLLALRQLLHPTSSNSSLRPPFLIFVQTIPRAIALHAELLYDIPPEAGGSSRIAVLHSDLSDTARSTIMTGFRKGEIWILVTTDLLSRGVDFRGMNGVVNYDIPNTGATYIHRVGRTGRQGREGGVAVTLYTKEDVKYVKGIANVIAASERAKSGKRKLEAEEGEGEGVQKWLLDALPRVSKKMKKELKMKGVEGRRKGERSGRISTKSGWDRRVEHNRRGTAEGTRRRGDGGDEDGGVEWSGFGD